MWQKAINSVLKRREVYYFYYNGGINKLIDKSSHLHFGVVSPGSKRRHLNIIKITVVIAHILDFTL
jgi:hypothetical protein